MKPKFKKEEKKLIGRRIRDARNAEKLTLEQLAEKCECSSKHIGDVERGTVSASWPLAVKIGKALKFYRQMEEIILANERELNLYLSSGTIKGLTVFMATVDIFKNGGILLIDEMENHFNRELVAVLIRVFPKYQDK